MISLYRDPKYYGDCYREVTWMWAEKTEKVNIADRTNQMRLVFFNFVKRPENRLYEWKMIQVLWGVKIARKGRKPFCQHKIRYRRSRFDRCDDVYRMLCDGRKNHRIRTFPDSLKSEQSSPGTRPLRQKNKEQSNLFHTKREEQRLEHYSDFWKSCPFQETLCRIFLLHQKMAGKKKIPLVTTTANLFFSIISSLELTRNIKISHYHVVPQRES